MPNPKSEIRNPKSPACLAIGGFDPSGGAGVLADCEAIAAVGARPLAVVTTITAQSHLRFAAASPVPPGVVRAQIDALAGAYRVRAVKTGVLPTPRHVALAADAVTVLGVPLVVDPVLGASRGPGLVDPRVAAAIVADLLPLAALLTPNASEAGALAGRRVEDEDDAMAAAETLLRMGARAVLVKGGHLRGRDLLATPRRLRWLPGRLMPSVPTHGAGCALASAIAAGLALGRSLPEAVRAARTLVRAGMRSTARRRGAWGPDLIGMRLALAPSDAARGR